MHDTATATNKKSFYRIRKSCPSISSYFSVVFAAVLAVCCLRFIECGLEIFKVWSPYEYNGTGNSSSKPIRPV